MLKLSTLIRSSPAKRFFWLCSRSFISQPYYCNELWKSRLSHPSFQDVTARDLGVSILQAINANREVSPLDYDIFANKLHELDVVSLDFIENIIEKYAHTQSAIEVVDSTTHAIVRSYLEFQKYESLLNLAKRRATTGVFLDTVSANMLADHFTDAEDWDSVTNTIWELCLQNYFHSHSVSPLTMAFGLLSGVKLVQNFPEEQTSVTSDADEEVQYVFVPYVRNPNYDNFFDIDRLRLKLGFLWLQMLDLFENRLHALDTVPSVLKSLDSVRPYIATGLKLFGLSLSEQIHRLKAELQQFQSPDNLEKKHLSRNVLVNLLRITESARTRDDTQPVERGQPVLPIQSDVISAVNRIQQLIEWSKPLSEDFFTHCENFVHDGILSDDLCMQHEIESVRQLYTRFSREREERWTTRQKTNRTEAILRDTRQTLRQLLDEEERLNFFKNPDEINLQAWLAPRTLKERRWSRMKEWRQDIMRQQTNQQNNRETQAS